MGMSGIQVGRRVEWVSFNDTKRIFRGELLSMLAGGYYGLVDDHTGLKPRIVRASRLYSPGYFTPAPSGEAA